MSGDRGSKEGRGRGPKLAEPRDRARGKKPERAPEELSPEQRTELARRIEAKRFRGKPPSI